MGEQADLICVVDDDGSVRRALGRMIKSFGFEVELISSARECLDGTHIDRADCLVLDIAMPDIDGFELYSLLKASGRDLPTVIVTAHHEPTYRDKVLALENAAFLLKPCEPESLRSAIEKVLGRAARLR